jgi:hypothetical protein
MANVNIKIVGIEGDSVLIKYASETSKRSIDEYDAVAYQPKDMGHTDVNVFLDSIKDSVAQQCLLRDKLENVDTSNTNISSWVGTDITHQVDVVQDIYQYSDNEVVL